MVLPSRLGCPMSQKTPNMGNIGFTPLAEARRRQRWTRNMVHGTHRIPYWIDRRLTGLAGPDYDATISIGLPFEPEDSQYGEYRLKPLQASMSVAARKGGAMASGPSLTTSF